jgi:hypothetical protein
MTPPDIIASGRISRNRANEQHFNPSRKLPKNSPALALMPVLPGLCSQRSSRIGKLTK